MKVRLNCGFSEEWRGKRRLGLLEIDSRGLLCQAVGRKFASAAKPFLAKHSFALHASENPGAWDECIGTAANTRC
jgi:hypothetical protein